MRSVVMVGLLGGLAGAVGLMSLTVLPRPAEDAADVEPTLHPAIGASLALGERLWHAACPVEEVDGACIELAPAVNTPPGGLPTRCGDSAMRHWIVIPRDADTKAAALALFADVIDRLGAWAPTNPELRYDLGLARLYEGDALREAALAFAAPTDLDFDPEPGHEAVRQRSLQRFRAWLDARGAARERAAAKYAEVVAGKQPRTIVAAAARGAQLAEDVADQLFTLDIPSSLRTGERAVDRVEAYCDTVVEIADPALTAAADGYVACFAKATELDEFSAWSTLCETALERLRPAQYPMLNELRRRPERDAPASRSPTADDYAIGLHDAGRGALVDALHHFEAAIADDPSSIMPWIDAGLIALQLRKYDAAARLFARAVELAPASYDALVGLGIARRGLGDLDGAEASYEKARASDPTRGDAYYDLGLLYKDFRAMVAGDPDPVIALHRSRVMYRRGRELFAQFLDHTGRPSDQADALTQIGWCDRSIAQIDTFLAGR
jgi:tetratricopeptide (TPR) repeat protein